MTPAEPTLTPLFNNLGLQLIQRDWLSSNHIVFKAGLGHGAAVVDTGFDSHAEMTCALVARAIAEQPLTRIVNTHLHSDHCGGNAALQQRYPCATWVPEPSLQPVRDWDMAALSFDHLDQHCQRFQAEHALCPGDSLPLGLARWQVHAAPGHDPHAVLLFQPDSGVLISGDALWEQRVAIIFPELEDGDGFGPALATLDLIEQLRPQVVIPGHGRAFRDAKAAIAQSRARLARFQADPASHTRYATRALVMFHMLQGQRLPRSALLAWMMATPLFRRLGPAADADTVLAGLVSDGALQLHPENMIGLP